MAKEDKDKQAKIFEKLTGRKFRPRKRDKFPKMESLAEIDRLMRDKPNSGRE